MNANTDSRLPNIAFDNSYARDLNGFYVACKPVPSPQPRLIKLNLDLAEELGLEPESLSGPGGLAVLSGNTVPDGAEPLAQAYAGHQFGGYSPQLGDGRALLLGEVIDRHGRRRDVAFKGSGRTPFSRGGDGKAALGPVLREYLIGEAMHVLGIPTTRALAAVATGEGVRRERMLPGAMLTRVAASHVRVGTFQYFAARRDDAMLRQLADYVIARHYAELAGVSNPYLELLRTVTERQAALIARWMGIGFIHGVMNTDNMTISGETIDYGPCAFMEAYDPKTVFSSIDEHGRYAYGNQPGIAQWNLARFAESLLPLMDPSPDIAVKMATDVIVEFFPRYEAHWRDVMRAKLGLDMSTPAAEVDALAESYLQLLEARQVDFTLGFRRLVDAAEGHDAPLRALMAGDEVDSWLVRWRACPRGQAVIDAMRRANPIYIARNHQVEAALSAATDHDDLAPFDRLLSALRDPFVERAADVIYAEPAPREVTACYRTFCGT